MGQKVVRGIMRFIENHTRHSISSISSQAAAALMLSYNISSSNRLEQRLILPR